MLIFKLNLILFSLILVDVGSQEAQPPIKRFCQPRQSLLNKRSLVPESLQMANEAGEQLLPSALSVLSKPVTKPHHVDDKGSQKGKPPFLAMTTFHSALKKRQEAEVLECETVETDLKRLRTENIPTFARRCCRVAFGPNGTFVVVNNICGDNQAGFDFKAVSTVCSLHKVVEMDTTTWSKRMMERQLRIHLCAPTIEESVIPESEVGKHVTELDELFVGNQMTKDSRCQDELEMWRLCMILWPPEEDEEDVVEEESFLLTQRMNMTEWLKSNASMLFGNLYDRNDKSFMGLLSKGEDVEAAKMALIEDCYFLASMISQDTKHSEVFAMNSTLITNYFNSLRERSALKFVDPKILNVFLTFCESPTYGSLNLTTMTTDEWFQHFAIYYWYFCPITMPLGNAVASFQSLLKSQVGDNTVDVAFPSKCDSSIANLCIHLLKMYSCTGYPLEVLFNPRTNNPNPIDYKLSWMLMNNLMQYGYVAGQELYESVTIGFAGQLESMNMYKWAIFVLKHLPACPSRNVMVQRILERNLKCKNDNENEQFLVDKVGVPPEMIFSVKSILASKIPRL